jgi:radical SAM superfamily enzyme YgiQ (UPF0313 family)
MEAALIHPPNQESPDIPGTPLSLGYLASYLESKEHTGRIYDFERSTEPLPTLVSKFALSSFSLVGITTYTHTMKSAAGIAKEIKNLNPQCTVVMGGYHASALPREILKDFPWVSAVVKGDGEVPLYQIAESIEKGTGFDKIPNLTYKHNSSILSNGSISWEKGLDDYPYPKRRVENYNCNELPWFPDHDIKGGRSVLHIISSRGCPYKCDYCAIPSNEGGLVRFRKVEAVQEELSECAKEFSFQHIFFQDPNFLIRPTRALALGRYIQQELPGRTFSFEARADQIHAEQSILPELRRLGCCAVNVGVESASPNVLKRLNKGITPDENLLAILLLKRLGIRPQIYLIMFDPDSSINDLKANLAFLKKLGLFGALPHASILYDRLQPMPGTKYGDVFRSRFGIIDVHKIPPAVFTDPHVEMIWEFVDSFRFKYDLEISKVIRSINWLLGKGMVCVPGSCEKAIQHLQLLRCSLQLIPYQFIETCVLLSDKEEGREKITVTLAQYERKVEKYLKLATHLLSIINNGIRSTKGGDCQENKFVEHNANRD